ncbi:unnamed protein product [Protopolystoma xenopodis]|uniref:Uncharacterized protein n=1 Tax=Protopolystoma xenopodis TaxID=117903 RepID=A0A448X4T0_9PLAT|nr:unnamed protein product [Protopolystoma xenopodis]
MEICDENMSQMQRIDMTGLAVALGLLLFIYFPTLTVEATINLYYVLAVSRCVSFLDGIYLTADTIADNFGGFVGF